MSEPPGPQHWNAPPPQPWPAQPPQQPWPGQPEQQWAPQPGWPGQYGPPAPGPVVPGATIGTHVKRAIDWNVAEIVASPREQLHLNAAGIEPRLHGLFVWRRSTLITALPILLLTVVLSFIETARAGTDGFNAFGKLWAFLPSIALIFAPLGAIAVVGSWTNLRRASRTLVICWVLSIAIPLFTALIPLDFVVNVDDARQNVQLQGGDLSAFDAEIFSIRLALAVTFAMSLLPVVISVPGGVLRGAARIKSLFPSAALPGWFLVAVAPFYSLFTIVVFVLVDQIVGNGVLLVGVALLAFTPWLFVIYRRIYGRPLLVAEARVELARASRAGGYLFAAGIVFIAIFVFTADVGGQAVVGGDSDTSVFTYLQLSRTLAEVISRGLVTTVVFSMIFVSLVFAEWKTMTSMSGELKHEHDEQMRALQRYVESPAGSGEATLAGPAAS